MSRVVLVFSLLTVGALPRLGWADDAAQQLSDARVHWLRGRFAESIELYTKLVDQMPQREAAAVGLSRCYESLGDIERAADVLDRTIDELPGAHDARARRAELSLQRGLIERAREDCTRVLQASPDHLLARWIQLQLDLVSGDIQPALKGAEWFVQRHNRSAPMDAEALVITGQAAVIHATYRLRGGEQSQQLNAVLNNLYDEAIKLDPSYWPALYYSGRLFSEKHHKGDAINDLHRALTINPNAAEVHAALGMAAFDDFDIESGHTLVDRALAIRPNLPLARRLKADLLMARDQYTEAFEQLQKACKVNPGDAETLGRLAACQLLRGNRAEFEAVCAEALGHNPRPAVFFLRLAERLEDHRRFDSAEQYFEQSIAADPDRSDARTGLGLLYMRIGKEAEAAAALEQAFEMDPFNVRTKNMLEVLDRLAGYKTLETEHFRLKYDEELDGLLGTYAAKYLEDLYQELTARFGYSPGERIQIEIFNKGRGESAHRWFSARTVGLPWIGTVGACTGKVVAMTSPNGVEKPFNWARVLKHEVSHVITLQQTNYQIPHWYTEALAVQAEGYPRPQLWSQLLAKRLAADDLLDLGNINLAFAHPKTALDWQMAYCQSELYAAYMQQTHGNDSIARMLDEYRDGSTTSEAIEHVFKLSISDFELGYREYLREVASGFHMPPAEPPMTRAELDRAFAAHPENPDFAARLAAEYVKDRNYPKARELATRATTIRRGHPLGSFVLARLYQSVGENAKAMETLTGALNRDDPDPRVLELLANLTVQTKDYDRARSLYQLGHHFYGGDSKWTAGVARVALITDNRLELREALQQLCLLEPDDQAPRMKLATMAVEDGDLGQAIRFAWMVLHINASNRDAHRILGNAFSQQRRWGEAAGEYRVLIELQPDDWSSWIELARSYQASGDRDRALAVVTELLEKDPQNAQGRELLAELKR